MTKKLTYEEFEERIKALEGESLEHKRMEEALWESEERYCILTENVADGVILIQDGRLLSVNAVFVSMFGHADSDQLVGREAVELISDDFKQHFEEMNESIEKGVSNERVFQGRCLTGDGREIWIEGHNNRIRWKGKPAVLMAIRDITESRLKEMTVQDGTERLRRENIKLGASFKERYSFGDIIGKSSAMQEVYELILKAIASEVNVIIYGESGTGKEMIAKTIHYMSTRHDKTFVPVNSGAIPETLFESEFFGYRKGAFTGASVDKHGFFDIADGGTLFLDEVGELSLNMQVKLLRAIEGSGYTPVGSNQTKKSDFRLITATNKNLKDQANKGLMRKDFFYRIHIIPITIPPLKHRREDIPLLVDHFLRLHGNGKKSHALPGKIMEALYSHDWPGNVRELQNVLHRYLTLNRLDFMSSKPANVPVESSGVSNKAFDHEETNLRVAVENLEKAYISRVMEQTQWNRSKAALLLGISRRALFRKIKNFENT